MCNIYWLYDIASSKSTGIDIHTVISKTELPRTREEPRGAESAKFSSLRQASTLFHTSESHPTLWAYPRQTPPSVLDRHPLDLYAPLSPVRGDWRTRYLMCQEFLTDPQGSAYPVRHAVTHVAQQSFALVHPWNLKATQPVRR